MRHFVIQGTILNTPKTEILPSGTRLATIFVNPFSPSANNSGVFKVIAFNEKALLVETFFAGDEVNISGNLKANNFEKNYTTYYGIELVLSSITRH